MFAIQFQFVGQREWQTLNAVDLPTLAEAEASADYLARAYSGNEAASYKDNWRRMGGEGYIFAMRIVEA